MRRPPARSLWWTLLTLLALGAAPAAAQGLCTIELGAALRGVDDPALAAPLLLQRMLELIEPAYPALGSAAPPSEGVRERLLGDEATQQAVLAALEVVHRSGFLPARWSVSSHDHDAWRAMLSGFLSHYRAALPPLRPPEEGVAGMLVDAARVLAVASEAVRPLAVMAFDDELRPTLNVIVTNWTRFPRLIVQRPSTARAGGSLDEAVAATLAAMGTCALRLHYYLAVPERLALRFFLRQGASTLQVYALEPLPALPASAVPRLAAPLDFSPDEAMAMIAFSAPTLEGVFRYSAAVLGPAPPWTDVLQVIFSSKSNLTLSEAFSFLALP